MKFIDHTQIIATGGDGGSGICSFRRARHQARLGPDGGNGGNGGNVIFVGDEGLNTLSSLRYRQQYRAENGGKGGPNDRTGKCGDHLYIKVPLGTVVREQESEKVIGEILQDQQELVVAQGGKRGYGNCHFLTATHQAPTHILEGEKGVSRLIECELKLLADVGLAGFPNAGKSTLLSVISAARPKIADYPFTTITPNLGVVDMFDGANDRSFVVADVPGLLEGASEGKGLGLEFLKHLERTSIICVVIECSDTEERNPIESFHAIATELSSYGTTMASKKKLVVLSKADAAPDDFPFEDVESQFKNMGLETFIISSAQQRGIKELIIRLSELVYEEKQLEKAVLTNEKPLPNFTIAMNLED
jgi:GTP-binding protein